MQLRIQFRHLEISQEAKNAIERGVRLDLGRYSAIIAEARVALSPSRRCDFGEKQSRIRIRLRNGEALLGEGCGADPKEALDAAMWRIEHRLARRRLAQSDDRRAIGPTIAGY